MVRPTERDRSDAMATCDFNRNFRSQSTCELPETKCSVDRCRCTLATLHRRLRRGMQRAFSNLVHVPADAQDTVGIMAEQTRLDQGAGDRIRIGITRAMGNKHSSGETLQVIGPGEVHRTRSERDRPAGGGRFHDSAADTQRRQ